MEKSFYLVAVAAFLMLESNKSWAENTGVFSEARASEDTRCMFVRRSESTGYERYAEYVATLVGDDLRRGTKSWYSDAFIGVSTNLPADLMCIGRNVVINQDVHTNGGDIIIVADSLTVNASIDTRVYFQMNRNEFNRQKPNRPYWQYVEAMDSRYYETNAEAKTFGNGVYAPEMLHGVKPRDGFGAGQPDAGTINGTSPPELTSDESARLRSGSVKIFARNINFDKGVSSGTTQPADLCSTNQVSPNKFGVQAGGMRGAKGGRGGAAGCDVINGCVDLILTNVGYSGPPGNGGHAGSVLFSKLEGEFSADERLKISKAVNVKGGEPGPPQKLLTPTVFEFANSSSPNFCDFKRVDSYSPASNGIDGVLTIGRASVVESLSELEIFANTHDSFSTTDLRDLVLRARKNPDIVFKSFADFLRSTLARTAINGERSFAIGLASAFQLGLPFREKLNISPFQSIGSADAAAALLKLGPKISGLAQRLKSLDSKDAAEIPYAYFAQKGGVLNITSPTAIDTVLIKGLSEDLSEIQEAQLAQLNELQRISKDVSEFLFISKKQTLIAQLTEIQKNISLIQNATKNKPGSFERIYLAVSAASPAVSMLAADIGSENWFGTLKSLGPALSSLGAAYNELFGLQGSTVPEEIALVKMLSTLSIALERLTVEFNDERQIQLKRIANSALAELSARQKLSSRLDARLPLGEDLIKLALASYVQDMSKNIGTLAENLNEIALLLEGATDSTAMLRIRPLPKICDAIPNPELSAKRCALLTPGNTFTAYEAKIQNLNLPIYVVAPGDGQYVAPTLGLNMTKKAIIFRGLRR